MSEITTVWLDLAKNVVQAHRAEVSGRAVLRKKLRQVDVLESHDDAVLSWASIEVWRK